MKRLLSLVLASLLLLSAAAADLPDISGLTFAELVRLRDQINLAIWQSQEWQEVTVPPGVWVVGADIPEGHWTIRPVPDGYVYVVYCNILDEYDQSPAPGWKGWSGILNGEEDNQYDRSEVDLVMTMGMFFINQSQSVIFTPYTGRPDLGFQ